MNYIVGTGNFGIIIRAFLDANNIKISGYVELNPISISESHDNLPIVSLSKVVDVDTLYIGSNRYNHLWIQENLCQDFHTEFADIYINPDSLEEMDFPKTLTWSREKTEDEIRNYFMIRNFFNKGKNPTGSSVELNSLDVVVTERCTLKCLDCSNLMQYYEKPQNSEVQSLVNSLDKLLDASYINALRIIGGEPLINRSTSMLINHIFNKWRSRFNSIEIYTNGTILPDQKLIEACIDNPVTFYISDYGYNSKRINEVVDLLEKNGIRSAIESNLIWQDCGRILPYSDKNIDYKYANCCVAKTFSLLNEYLYSCPFSANFHNLNKNEERTDRDCIFIPTKSKLDLIDHINRVQMDSSPLSACYYCNGRDYSVKTIEVAQQTKKILKR